jgi:hypothetical protein
MLDNVVRFIGQRVVAVVAGVKPPRKKGPADLKSTRVLPAVFDPEVR